MRGALLLGQLDDAVGLALFPPLHHGRDEIAAVLEVPVERALGGVEVAARVPPPSPRSVHRGLNCANAASIQVSRRVVLHAPERTIRLRMLPLAPPPYGGVQCMTVPSPYAAVAEAQHGTTSTSVSRRSRSPRSGSGLSPSMSISILPAHATGRPRRAGHRSLFSSAPLPRWIFAVLALRPARLCPSIGIKRAPRSTSSTCGPPTARRRRSCRSPTGTSTSRSRWG